MAGALRGPTAQLLRSFIGRAVQGVFVVWASVSLLLVIFFLLPGDRVEQIFGTDRAVTPEARAALTEKFALDGSLLDQYANYWSNLAKGDLGISYVTGEDVADILGSAAPASLRLAFWALVVEVIGGVSLAVFVVARRSRLLDATTAVVDAALLSAPVFVIGFGLQLALGVHPFQNDWPEFLRFPVQGIGPDDWSAVFPSGDQWRHLVLPALTLGTASGVIAYRVTREAMRAAMQSSFVTAARLRGVSERRILLRHVVRNASLPVITFIGVDLAALFGGAVVTESIFNWPGIGLETATALQRGDAPVILGTTVVVATLYVVASVFVDVFGWLIDPRTRR